MGSMISSAKEAFPPKSKFNVEDIPDLTGKVVIVTGANTGIAVSQRKGKEAIFLKLDLSDLPSIKASVEEFQSKEKELHVLFNNAGVMAPPIAQTTAQGYDLQFGTNVLGHFFFTKLLIPTLAAGAKSSRDGKSRVVTTSSSGSNLVKTIDFDTLKDTPKRKKQRAFTLYGQSKLGNIIVSNEFARRYGDQGIVSTSLNPGNLQTDLARHMSSVERLFLKLIVYPAPLGALTQLYAGTSPEGVDFNGKYLIPWARIGKPNPAAEDAALSKALWTWLEEQVQNV
ncbi:hypothetical protein D9613_006134 [Agrocybe pediades]|uniref:NAD(P)-binding protein n=1 Tax=Agrocybe pediades TaxID=84607 RepID=A0A8H4QUZ5_9AGAR|nr:hypothetical protein D9613_006134 [Agrocybe pediades]